MSKRSNQQHVTGRYRQGTPPPAERDMPEKRVRRPGCLLGLGLLLAVLSAAATAALVLFVLLRPQPPDSHNAIWLGISWGETPQTDEDVRALAEQFQAQGVEVVYVWTTWLQEDGTWSPTTFEHMAAFVEQLRTYHPSARLDAWIGVPVELPGYRLDDEALQEEVARFAAQALQDFGFDGIHLNAEPVWDGDEPYLALLRAVRHAIGDEAVLSVAVPPDWNTGDPAIPAGPFTTPDAHWSQTYKQRVAFLVDEVAVMAYNSGLSSPLDYQTWMAYQVTRYVEALSVLDIDTRLIMGIPTYDAEPPGHDPDVESVQAAIAGILAGMAQSEDYDQPVTGIGIYAEWSTDALEWHNIRQLWVERDSH